MNSDSIMQQLTCQQKVYTMPVETPKRTGLLIGITSGAIALIATIVTIVLILALGSDPIVGT